MKLTPDLNEILLQSDSYRDFLTVAFAHLKASRRGFSYAILAKKIGCRSKSYPRDVMLGRRALTLDYAPRFAMAFGLKGDRRKLFLKMVDLERAEDKNRTQVEINKLKERLRNRVEHKTERPLDLFEDTSWIDVFAALGTPTEGAHVGDICSRTFLTEQKVRQIIEGMILKGIVQERGVSGFYLPLHLHHMFQGLEQDLIFQRRYLEVLERLRQKAKRSMKSEENLFLCSTISVQSTDLPRLKTDLRNLLNKYIQDSETATGNILTHLLVGQITNAELIGNSDPR